MGHCWFCVFFSDLCFLFKNKLKEWLISKVYYSITASSISTSVQQATGVCSEDQRKRCVDSCIPTKLEFNEINKCRNISVQQLVLRRNTRQAGKFPCILPEHPDNGTYTTHIPNTKPGDAYDLVTIKVTCNKGFKLIGAASSYCVGGLWSNPMPKCVTQCYLPPHPSVEYHCLNFEPMKGSRLCGQFEINGTVVSPQCRSPNYYPAIVLTYMRCIDGDWDYVAASRCIPECGTVAASGTQLLIGAETAKYAETPWHAGIYTKTTNPYKQICGGSLISNSIVLSAAHCFWSEHESVSLPAAEFAVAVGKFYRPWIASKEAAKKSDVREFHLPPNFDGSAANFQDDIAVVMLEEPVEYSNFIRPVCVDFDYYFMKSQLRAGNMGKLAGWGLTTVNETPSLTLKVIDLPYVTTETCIRDSPTAFRGFITSDKFCAGVTNGQKAVCKGDSGGGLAFPELERGAQRYYLRGIVSTSPSDENSCNSNVYTTFTMIQKHEHFIKEFWENGDPSLSITQKNSLAEDIKKPHQGACIIPDNPANGTYTTNISNAKPGDAFDTVIINVTCKQGYLPDAPGSFFCSMGFWTQKIPKCVLGCQLKPHPTVEYRCYSLGDVAHDRSCHEYEHKGTRVTPQCRPGYQSMVKLSQMVCDDGSWNYIAKCSLDCGTMIPDSVNAFGVLSRKAEVPWHAAVYSKTSKPYTLVYGGSLISSNIVITVGLHFWNKRSNLRVSNFAVAVGMLYQTWDKSTGEVQRSDVKEIHLPSNFRGEQINYQDDIAVVVTVKAFKFNNYVKPVCVNFDSEFEMQHMPQGKMGKLAGWDIKSGNEESSQVLQVVDLPFVAFGPCVWRQHSDQSTIEEICAGYRDDKTRPCFGYIGSGLVFPVLENDTQRYYLRGVLSPPSSPEGCNVNKLCIYARILLHKNFILPFLRTD